MFASLKRLEFLNKRLSFSLFSNDNPHSIFLGINLGEIIEIERKLFEDKADGIGDSKYFLLKASYGSK